MISNVFHAIVYEPLYNGLVFLIDLIPTHNVGLAVIALTIVVRLILYPSTRNAIISQMKLKELQPEIEDINKTHKDNKEEKARKTLELYRSKKVNPFAPIFPLFFQLPIVITLYYIFASSGLPVINHDLLYSFVHFPEIVSTNFFSLFDITEKSWPVAVVAGLSQFVQAYVYRRRTDVKALRKPSGTSFQADFERSMNVQMQYVFPILIIFFAHSFSAAIALYWTTTNLFSIMQELITHRPKNPNFTNR